MSETHDRRFRRSIEDQLKEVGIPVPIVKVEYEKGMLKHVWYHNLNRSITTDLIEIFDIIEIKRVINSQNRTAVQLTIDGYLSEEETGGTMSEVAEPENGEEPENGGENGEEQAAQGEEEAAAATEENGEGEEAAESGEATE